MSNRVFGQISFRSEEDLQKIVPYLTTSEYSIEGLDIHVNRLTPILSHMGPEAESVNAVQQWSDDTGAPTQIYIDCVGAFQSIEKDQVVHSGFWKNELGEKFCDENIHDLIKDCIGRDIDLMVWEYVDNSDEEE